MTPLQRFERAFADYVDRLIRLTWTKQTTSWVNHALVTLLVPFALAWLAEDRHRAAAFFAALIALVFGVIKEREDKARHLAKGDYDKPDGQGITPRIDRWGDTLGPAVVAFAYFLAWLLA